MKRLIRIVFILMVIGLLVYAGACIYGNVKSNSGQPAVKLPDVSKAKYEVVVVNTGRLLLSNEVVRTGTTVKLTGYWELIGLKYVYRNRAIVLDEQSFGKINIGLRKEASK
jgi:hypothetical protein